MLNMRLESGEEVLYEAERVVLTNKRLLAYLDKKSKDLLSDEVALTDIAGFKKLSGGQESRLKQGVISLIVGLALTLVQFALVGKVSFTVDGVIFMVSTLFILGGLYFTLTSLIRIRPNTTVVFSVVGARDIPVRFPGRDSPSADEMTRLFARAKRGIS